MNRLRTSFLAIALVIPAASAAQEDTAGSQFATDLQVSLSGTVSSFQWSDPHCRMTLMVALPDGREVAWRLQLAAPAALEARGWRPNSLKPGNKVELEINPSLDGTTSGLVLAAKRGNGKPIGRSAEIS